MTCSRKWETIEESTNGKPNKPFDKLTPIMTAKPTKCNFSKLSKSYSVNHHHKTMEDTTIKILVGETNPITISRNRDGTTIKTMDGVRASPISRVGIKEINKDGTKTIRTKDGAIIRTKDGEITKINKDGIKITKIKDGATITIKDGAKIKIIKDGTKIIKIKVGATITINRDGIQIKDQIITDGATREETISREDGEISLKTTMEVTMEKDGDDFRL